MAHSRGHFLSFVLGVVALSRSTTIGRVVRRLATAVERVLGHFEAMDCLTMRAAKVWDGSAGYQVAGRLAK